MAARIPESLSAPDAKAVIAAPSNPAPNAVPRLRRQTSSTTAEPTAKIIKNTGVQEKVQAQEQFPHQDFGQPGFATRHLRTVRNAGEEQPARQEQPGRRGQPGPHPKKQAGQPAFPEKTDRRAEAQTSSASEPPTSAPMVGNPRIRTAASPTTSAGTRNSRRPVDERAHSPP